MWIALSVAAMVSTSARFIFTKKAIQKQHELVAIAAMFVIATIVAGFYSLVAGIYIARSNFFIWLAIRIIIDSVAMITNFRAFKYQEVSYVMPLISLIPVLSIGTSFLLNGETPSSGAFIGILLVVAGVGTLFSVNINWKNFEANHNVLKATGYMLVTILIWSMAEAIHKKATILSSPATYFFLSYAGFSIVFVTLSLFTQRKQLIDAFRTPIKSINLGNGITMGLDRMFSLNAISTGLVAYVGAIKSSSVALTSILAAIILKEKISKLEGVGICLSTIGVIVIALS